MRHEHRARASTPRPRGFSGIFPPLTCYGIKGFGRTGYDSRADSTLNTGAGAVLGQRGQIAPGCFHYGVSGEERLPSLRKSPIDLFFRTVGQELYVILQRSKMPLRVDQRFHVVWVEVKIFVIR